MKNRAIVLILLPALLAGLAPAADSAETSTEPSPAPNVFWVPPAREPLPQPPAPEIPAGVESRVQDMSLVDVLDVALQNNPDTRAAWEDARAAAARLASKKGDYWPQISADANVVAYKTPATQGRQISQQTTYTGTGSLSWLLLDFGGRSATVSGARQALFAADWTHNAVIQRVVLEVTLAYYRYMAAKALLKAQAASLAEAEANLDAAERRHDAGLATIADVLQAKTALSQAQLAHETLQGSLFTTRGSLAVSMGLPANVPFDIEERPKDVPSDAVLETVESLIQTALEERPDLAALRAQAQAAHERIRQIRSDGRPTFTANASAGRTYLDQFDRHADGYSAGLYIRIPIFTGFSQTNDVREAEAAARATSERADSLRNIVIYQVFSSYYDLKTATQRVKTAADLLASALQSEAVAQDRYKVGVGTIIELLTAQQALAQARAQNILAQWDWYTALTQLAHDTGVLGLRGEIPIAPTAPSPEKD